MKAATAKGNRRDAAKTPVFHIKSPLKTHTHTQAQPHKNTRQEITFTTCSFQNHKTPKKKQQRLRDLSFCHRVMEHQVEDI